MRGAETSGSPTCERPVHLSLVPQGSTYADGTGQPWFILSAQYGLVHPDELIAPYDLTLNAMPVADRRRWASRVLTQLEPHLNGIRSVTFLAGRRYREFLEPSLRSRGLAVSIPMEGLRIGEQLRKEVLCPSSSTT